MTPLQKELEAFEEGLAGALMQDTLTRDRWIRKSLSASLLRFTRSVIEEAMPKEKEEGHTEQVPDVMAMNYLIGRNKGWNEHRTQLKENVERVLQDNEKEV